MINSISVTATNPTQTAQYEVAALTADQGAIIPNVGDIVAGPGFTLIVTSRIFRFTATALAVQLETKQT